MNRITRLSVPIFVVACLFVVGCGSKSPESSAQPEARSEKPAQSTGLPATEASTPNSTEKIIRIEPGPDAQTKIQEAFITAQPGTIIYLAAGRYDLTMGLSLDVDGVTVRGEGMDKTILNFKNQQAGSEGLYVTSDHVTLEDFAIEDTKGNCHKSNGADYHVIRRVRAEWTAGPKTENGAYGLYPVSSQNVLIEDCVARGASDSGIYVGQSDNVVVRNCKAEFNVAGIEIENCHNAEVYGNVATRNTGGILVFDLPDLPKQRGHNIRVYRNKVFKNDTENFAPAGNIVATVPTGTGIMVMANSHVEVFENEVSDHFTTNVLLVSYLSTQIPIKDPNYYPYVENVYVHHNTFGPCGMSPRGKAGTLMATLAGTPLPDIVWDGIVNPEKVQKGELPPHANLFFADNKRNDGAEVTFVNLDAGVAFQDPLKAQPRRDIQAHQGSMEPVPAVSLDWVPKST